MSINVTDIWRSIGLSRPCKRSRMSYSVGLSETGLILLTSTLSNISVRAEIASKTSNSIQRDSLTVVIQLHRSQSYQVIDMIVVIISPRKIAPGSQFSWQILPLNGLLLLSSPRRYLEDIGSRSLSCPSPGRSATSSGVSAGRKTNVSK